MLRPGRREHNPAHAGLLFWGIVGCPITAVGSLTSRTRVISRSISSRSLAVATGGEHAHHLVKWSTMLGTARIVSTDRRARVWTAADVANEQCASRAGPAMRFAHDRSLNACSATGMAASCRPELV